MARAKLIRWVCPDCGQGKLAPSRPRRDDTRRYCLRCSEKTGRLVERAAPVLEAKRQRGAERSRTKAQTRAEQQRAARRYAQILDVVEADGSLGELHVGKTLAKMAKLKSIRAASMFRYAMVPDITFRRSQSKAHTSGHAYYAGGPIAITFAKGVTRADAEVTMLHELAHTIMPVEESHGYRWRDAFVRACHQWFGPDFDEVRGDDDKWALEQRMIREAERVLRRKIDKERQAA
jgi:hypothetical protein